MPAMVGVGAGAIKAGEAFIEIGASLAAFDKALGVAKHRLERFAASAQAIASASLGAGAAIAAPLAIGARESIKFQGQMANVATMLDQQSMSLLPAMSKGLREMSVEFGESTATLTRGLYDILSASVPASEAMGVLEASIKAATAGMTDTAVAADAITSVINAYGLSAQDATSVSDFLFATVKRGKTTFPELASVIGRVAPTAALAGVSLEEVGAVMATLTRSGISTEEAAVSLVAALRTFLKPADESKEAAKRFGIELSAATLKADGLIPTLRKLRGANAEVVAQLFPEIRGLRGVATALGDLDGLAADYQEQLKRTGSTQAAFEIISATTAYQARRLKQSLADLARAAGDALEPKIMAATQSVKDWLDAARAWIAVNPGLIRGVADIAVKLVALGAGLTIVAVAARAASASLAVLAALVSPTGIFVVGSIAGAAALLKIAESLGIVDLGIDDIWKSQDRVNLGFRGWVAVIMQVGTAWDNMWTRVKIGVKVSVQSLLAEAQRFLIGFVGVFEQILKAVAEIMTRLRAITRAALEALPLIGEDAAAGFKAISDAEIKGIEAAAEAVASARERLLAGSKAALEETRREVAAMQAEIDGRTDAMREKLDKLFEAPKAETPGQTAPERAAESAAKRQSTVIRDAFNRGVAAFSRVAESASGILGQLVDAQRSIIEAPSVERGVVGGFGMPQGPGFTLAGRAGETFVGGALLDVTRRNSDYNRQSRDALLRIERLSGGGLANG